MDYPQSNKDDLMNQSNEPAKELNESAAVSTVPSMTDINEQILGQFMQQFNSQDFSILYNEYINTMINNMTVPAYFADTDAVILGCNRRFETLLGYSKDEIIRRGLREVMPEFISDDDPQFTDKNDRDPDMIHYETVIEDSRQNRKEVIISKSVVKQIEGSIAGVIGVIDDVTEKRIAERALIESERKLREANAAKDRFFSIISHDLRSPFASILGITDTLISMYPELSDEQKFDFIKDAAAAAKKAFRLVENLLAWAKTQLGELTITPQPVRLYPIVKELVDLYTPLAKQKKMDIIFDIPKDTELFADEQTIALVIRNLVNNAVKFNRDGEPIIISAREEGPRVIIFIRDGGEGIKPEDIDKLFHLDTNSKVGNSPQKGSGLGLLLCKQFTELNKGTISVKSEFGSFTEFTVIVPSASYESASKTDFHRRTLPID